MKWLLLLLGLLCFSPSVAYGQWLDPDTCWTCRDSQEHFASGFILDAGLHMFKHWELTNKPWKRVVVIGVAGIIYELGQTDISRTQGIAGQRGYGFSFKDEALNIGGAITSEVVLWGIKKVF